MKIIKSLNKSRICEILTISLLFFIFIYVIIRAFILDLTYDEAYTFLYTIVRDPPFFYSSSNHLLNTILVTIFTSFLGHSEIVIRIPALLGCFLYLIGVYYISKLIFKNKIFSLINVVILTLNPAMLDFFSLSRGYSLALGFMMGGLYFFTRTLLNVGSSKKNILICFIMLALSVMAITTFLYVFLAILFISFYFEFIKIYNKKKSINSNLSFSRKFKYLMKYLFRSNLFPMLPGIIIIILTIGLFALPLFILGKFTWGIGDFIGMIDSLLEISTYNNGFFILEVPQLFLMFWIFTIISTIIFTIIISRKLIKYINKKKKLNTNEKLLFGISSVLFGSILMIFLQFFFLSILNLIILKLIIPIFGNEFSILDKTIVIPEMEINLSFPRSRAAIFLIPLYSLFTVLLWNFVSTKFYNKLKNSNFEISRYYKKLKLLNTFGFYSTQVYFSLFLLISVSNMVNNINFTHTYRWKYCAQVEFAMTDLMQLNPDNHGLNVYVSRVLLISIQYYKYKYQLDWFYCHVDLDPNFNYAYYIICGFFDTHLINDRNLTIINYYPLGNTYLLKSSD